MYEPVFNSVIVQIDDKDGEWGSGNDDSMLGKSFSKGTFITWGTLIPEATHLLSTEKAILELGKSLNALKGKKIMWNEGTEAGTLFEFDGKQFGMIYWWDIRGVLVGEIAKADQKVFPNLGLAGKL